MQAAPQVIPTGSSLQLTGLALGLLCAAVVAAALWRGVFLLEKFLSGMSQAQETLDRLTRSIQSHERR
jgi:hypothetical protein